MWLRGSANPGQLWGDSGCGRNSIVRPTSESAGDRPCGDALVERGDCGSEYIASQHFVIMYGVLTIVLALHQWLHRLRFRDIR
jgi:hypothetical protein